MKGGTSERVAPRMPAPEVTGPVSEWGVVGLIASLVPRSEVRRLGVVVDPALDLLLLGEQALELGIGLLDEGLVLGGGRLLDGGGLGGAAPAGRRRHHALAA